MNLSDAFKAMAKVKEIFSAWGIMFNPNDAQAELATERIQICNGCENKKTEPFIHCGLCGCALKSKIFSPVQGACPDNRWNEVDAKFLNKDNEAN
jgi:hypothetical protein